MCSKTPIGALHNLQGRKTGPEALICANAFLLRCLALGEVSVPTSNVQSQHVIM